MWGIRQMAATRPIRGYLGGVAISPYTSLLKDDFEAINVLAANMVPAMLSLFPDFKSKEILTPEGDRLVELVHKTDTGVSSVVILLSDIIALRPDWKANKTI